VDNRRAGRAVVLKAKTAWATAVVALAVALALAAVAVVVKNFQDPQDPQDPSQLQRCRQWLQLGGLHRVGNCILLFQNWKTLRISLFLLVEIIAEEDFSWIIVTQRKDIFEERIDSSHLCPLVETVQRMVV
jgi:hypothetical protein